MSKEGENNTDPFARFRQRSLSGIYNAYSAEKEKAEKAGREYELRKRGVAFLQDGKRK